MTLGDKIKQARNMRGLTQKELGTLVNLPTFRIGQYETGIRKPKEAQLEEIASVLGVNIEYFRERSIDTYIDAMHALFELEKLYDMKMIKLDKDSVNEQFALIFDDSVLNKYINQWAKQKENSILSAKDKENYEKWKIIFPTSLIDDNKKKINEYTKNPTDSMPK